jgi:hypothetical protein
MLLLRFCPCFPERYSNDIGYSLSAPLTEVDSELHLVKDI